VNILYFEVKGQGHGKTRYNQKGTLRIFEVTGSEVRVTGRHTTQQCNVVDHLMVLLLFSSLPQFSYDCSHRMPYKVASWCCGRVSDSRSRGHGFEPRPGTMA